MDADCCLSVGIAGGVAVSAGGGGQRDSEAAKAGGRSPTTSGVCPPRRMGGGSTEPRSASGENGRTNYDHMTWSISFPFSETPFAVELFKGEGISRPIATVPFVTYRKW